MSDMKTLQGIVGDKLKVVQRRGQQPGHQVNIPNLGDYGSDDDAKIDLLREAQKKLAAKGHKFRLSISSGRQGPDGKTVWSPWPSLIEVVEGGGESTNAELERYKALDAALEAGLSPEGYRQMKSKLFGSSESTASTEATTTETTSDPPAEDAAF